MIGLLLILGLFASLLGIPPGGEGDDGHDHGPLAAPPIGSLERIEVHRSGGVAYQELQATIDDQRAVDALTELLPSPLPELEGPTGTCADCWVYRVELVSPGDSAGDDPLGPIVLEFDQANQPPELDPFVDALDDALE
jgi:hypothetical protein